MTIENQFAWHVPARRKRVCDGNQNNSGNAVVVTRICCNPLSIELDDGCNRRADSSNRDQPGWSLLRYLYYNDVYSCVTVPSEVDVIVAGSSLPVCQQRNGVFVFLSARFQSTRLLLKYCTFCRTRGEGA